MPTRETDHEGVGLGRLITPFAGKPDFRALLASYLKEVQEAEDALMDLIDLLPADAVPVQNTAWLDILGRIVGQPREGRSNDVYALWIQARILVNAASGTPEEMLSIAKLTTGAAVGNLIYFEGTDAEASITMLEVLSGEDGAAVAAILQTAKPAGVHWFFLWYVEEETFQFSDTDTVVSSTDKGFSDDTLTTVGGAFASAR